MRNEKPRWLFCLENFPPPESGRIFRVSYGYLREATHGRLFIRGRSRRAPMALTLRLSAGWKRAPAQGQRLPLSRPRASSTLVLVRISRVRLCEVGLGNGERWGGNGGPEDISVDYRLNDCDAMATIARPMGREAVAAGEGTLNTFKMLRDGLKWKSSTKEPSEQMACALTPADPGTISAAVLAGTRRCSARRKALFRSER